MLAEGAPHVSCLAQGCGRQRLLGLNRDLAPARYAADRAFRQYDAAEPANRLVARELEARWNKGAHAIGRG
jgi:hypothetical protein